eukprot:4922620-Amphidinium_carterae.1
MAVWPVKPPTVQFSQPSQHELVAPPDVLDKDRERNTEPSVGPQSLSWHVLHPPRAKTTTPFKRRWSLAMTVLRISGYLLASSSPNCARDGCAGPKT